MVTNRLELITALIVVEDELTRLGVRLLLRGMPAVRDTVEAKGRREAVTLTGRTANELAVVEVSQAGRAEALSTLLDLASMRPDVALVAYADDCRLVHDHCARYDLTCACVARSPNSARELRKVVDRLAGVTAGSAAAPASSAADGADLIASLTAREQAILGLVASGESSKAIARALGVSVRTVESHRARIGAKLGVRTIAGMTKLAVGAGLTSLEVTG